MPKIKLAFNERPIFYGEFADTEYKQMSTEGLAYKRWKKRLPSDRTVGDTVARTENGKLSQFTTSYLKLKEVSPTITAGGETYRFDVPGQPSDRDMKIISTFPQDYDFDKCNCRYVCGMSVPPFMMRGVARAVAEQLLPFAKES